jgi:hypothetical protein
MQNKNDLSQTIERIFRKNIETIRSIIRVHIEPRWTAFGLCAAIGLAFFHERDLLAVDGLPLYPEDTERGGGTAEDVGRK